MKWPEQLTLIRHDTSTFNASKVAKETDELYLRFREAFEANPESEETHDLALQVHEKFKPTVGDWDTPLWDGESPNACTVGQNLTKHIDCPDVIFVSPYIRTQATLAGLVRGWPNLGTVRTYVDDRLREQEHGLANLFGDWRVFHALHPEQRLLYNMHKRYFYCFPQGESVPNVRERIALWLNTITRDFASKRILVVTHHLTILSIRASLERLSYEQFIHLDKHEKPMNCGATFYRGYPNLGSDGHLALEQYNVKLY